MTSATAQVVQGVVLPSGQTARLYIVDGHITLEPQPGAEQIAQGYIVPGLVDAHCHIGLGPTGAVSDAEAEAQAIADRDGGALLLRDCGSAADTAWMHERDDLPRLLRAGRHIARTRRYIRNYAAEVEPAQLAAEVALQAQRGDGWVKLVGDWISREEGDLLPSFSAAEFELAIQVAHDHGAKVTAHCFGPDVLPGLINAGIDCIEHGTGLSPELIDQMVAGKIALVPTVMQTDNFPLHAAAGEAKFPAYAARMRRLYETRKETLMAAWEAGVQIFAGSDGGGVADHGNLSGEILALHEMGIPAVDALAAASWKAREWLGYPPELTEGVPADFVVYERDPRTDLSVVAEPACVVLRGQRVA